MKLPSNSTAITPHLTVRNVRDAVLFYERAFGFRTKLMLPGKQTDDIMHAEIEHEGCCLMLGPESPARGMLAPISRGGPPSVNLYLYVGSVDAVHARAIECGATELLPLSDQYFGARTSVVADPDGHQWMLAEHQKEMSERELREAVRAPGQPAKAHAGRELRRRYRTR